MNKRITIAIDGFSSTGKSTVAKQLARELGYVYVDTGAMYRAVSFYAMRNDLITPTSFDKEGLVAKLDNIQLKFIFDPDLGYAAIYLNDENIEDEIRTLEVSNYVSKVAAVSQVREKLVSQQQLMGKEKGVVMDGRDIGTVVFPHAELKLFMTATSKERAQRRYKELIEKGQEVNYEEVLKNVEERDHLDTTREDSPLVKAQDAIEIDNSSLSIEEQFEKILKLSLDKIAEVNSAE
ncbi:(d)CMP kinase [Antarcticibacterium flavum]|uniref:Cytidylate kinase n=1 Tax=Antarcticibacterium flavum TaxID=2058175 RepID=A0A5B7WYZ4_9FLAO|nr:MULTISPECIES: (d)CMP kinase [Antarcticibacterium]MCM4161208.1 (d)CMP kinase [Antarcticibacterium sp. W02-3]QCY68290.1 (d)CMP kinase [Antarcticibacterium flavum]